MYIWLLRYLLIFQILHSHPISHDEIHLANNFLSSYIYLKLTEIINDCNISKPADQFYTTP